jgi:hypothetical protein
LYAAAGNSERHQIEVVELIHPVGSHVVCHWHMFHNFSLARRAHTGNAAEVKACSMCTCSTTINNEVQVLCDSKIWGSENDGSTAQTLTFNGQVNIM